MSNDDYRALLRDPRWQRKRLEVLQRDDWKCRHCGEATRELQVHHKRYERGKMPWEYADRVLVSLCEPCHKRVTELKKKASEALAELTANQLENVIGALEGKHPLQALLDFLDRERSSLISNPYSKEASHRLEAIDELERNVWDLLAGAVS